jgi:hypothetical protein
MPTEEVIEFVAFDWCGWDERQGRFTHMPSGKTIVQGVDATQKGWDAKQLAFFKEYPPSTPVCRCPDGPYRLNDNRMGTCGSIVDKLTSRLAVDSH